MQSSILRTLFAATATSSLVVALLTISSCDGAALMPTSHAKQLSLRENLRQLPLRFEPAAGAARFEARADGHHLSLTGTEAVLRLASAELRMQLVNADPAARGAGIDELPGQSNHLLGNDPRAWRTGVVGFAKVRYRHVYPGIDLVYYGRGRQLEYDFRLAPDARPEAIKLRFSGAQRMVVDAAGDLVLDVNGEEVRMQRPVAYQEQNGQRREIAARYVINERREVAFTVAAYDRTRPLVIDPVLTYAALIDSEFINAIAIDTEGAIYFTGLARSAVFPISPGAQRTVRGELNRSAAYVAKLNAAGTALVYATYVGGFEGYDYPFGIAVDGSGHAYVVGVSASPDFPTTAGALQRSFNGPEQGTDGFALKLNPTGTGLVYATFLGGLGSEQASDVAVDAAGNAYIAGNTGSSNFPISPDAPQRSISGFNGSGFVSKLNAAGSGIVWSTFVGRSNRDSAQAVAIDPVGNAYVTGEAFPNIYAAKINVDGKSFGYYTRLTGPSAYSEGLSIAVDAAGNAYFTGLAHPGLMTTSNAFQRQHGGGTYDAFVAKLDAAGVVAYLNYLGGRGSDTGSSIAVDAEGSAYVAGETYSDNFPTQNAFQPNFSGGNASSNTNAFVTKLSAEGATLGFSSYYGLGGDAVTDIVVTEPGKVIIAGRGAALSAGEFFSTNPTALQSPYGTIGGFITKLDETRPGAADLTVTLTPNGSFYQNTIVSYVATVTNVGTVASAGPARLQVNFTSDVSVQDASGVGWYGFGQFVGNPVVQVYTGSLAPGQSTRLFIAFFARANVSATAIVSNVSDGNATNNMATDMTALSRGCFSGGFQRQSESLPSAGGTFTHPVNIGCATPWQAVSNAAWITINSGPQTGNGRFSYTVAPNPTGSARVGSIVYEGTAIELGQSGAALLANVSAAAFGGSVISPRVTVAPDSIVALFGAELAARTEAATTLPLPTTLAGTTVTIKDSFGVEHRAPLFFAAPGQINYLLPATVATGHATVTVANEAGRTQTGLLQVASLTPGLFTANATGNGVPAGVLLRAKADGTQSYEPIAEFNQTQNRFVPRPIDFGPDLGAASDQLFLVLFGTGWRGRSSLATVAVLNSEGSAPALYAGPQGELIGVDQVNIQLNRRMINFGTLNLTLYADGQPSNGTQIQFKR